MHSNDITDVQLDRKCVKKPSQEEKKDFNKWGSLERDILCKYNCMDQQFLFYISQILRFEENCISPKANLKAGWLEARSSKVESSRFQS